MFTSIAIIGRPNVGKSTLFNKLTRSRQAIVSDFSGLTKDRNYGYITFGEEKSLIIDTGGIAQDNSILKEDIAEQAWIAAEEASLIIFPTIQITHGYNSRSFSDMFQIFCCNKILIFFKSW